MTLDERVALWKSLPVPSVDETDGFVTMLIEDRDRLKAELANAIKEIDEMQEPMSCGHAQAEMQPSDEGPDMCIACYLASELESQLAVAHERMAKDKDYIENFLQPKLAVAIEGLQGIKEDYCNCDIRDSWGECDCSKLRDKAKDALAQLSDTRGENG
jgi:hypothetical protein